MPSTVPDPRSRRRPLGAAGLLTLAVVVLGLAAAGVAGLLTGSARQDAVEVVSSPPTPSATPSPTDPPPAAAAPAVPVAPATPPPAAAPSPTAPVRVAIAGRDVEVPVDPVGVAPDGQMEIPPLAERGGWYRFGADPGDDAGTTVVAAHVDSIASGGAGPFARLVDVRPGDSVEVTLADGSTRAYAVDAVTRFPKDEARWPDVFTRDGPPRLALVTCGGEFDRASRHYVDNVLVTATPVGA
ncbi:class F sortase [Cellulomonas pakistanensis]|uniref:Class F sortase n=1 Tax=Cellulomonas pakistanensis TaxID=992287 RepID=A0A919PBV7_9CELL|nr:class F sortase [Cellulomonas pakistanensis]GIG36710.1 hypothetical protein Cpa01nite_20910 [Cellulomonas pakistanensis]